MASSWDGLPCEIKQIIIAHAIFTLIDSTTLCAADHSITALIDTLGHDICLKPLEECVGDLKGHVRAATCAIDELIKANQSPSSSSRTAINKYLNQSRPGIRFTANDSLSPPKADDPIVTKLKTLYHEIHISMEKVITMNTIVAKAKSVLATNVSRPLKARR